MVCFGILWFALALFVVCFGLLSHASCLIWPLKHHSFNGLSNAKVLSIGSDNAFSWLHEHHSLNGLSNGKALSIGSDNAFSWLHA